MYPGRWIPPAERYQVTVDATGDMVYDGFSELAARLACEVYALRYGRAVIWLDGYFLRLCRAPWD